MVQREKGSEPQGDGIRTSKPAGSKPSLPSRFDDRQKHILGKDGRAMGQCELPLTRIKIPASVQQRHFFLPPRCIAKVTTAKRTLASTNTIEIATGVKDPFGYGANTEYELPLSIAG